MAKAPRTISSLEDQCNYFFGDVYINHTNAPDIDEILKQVSKLKEALRKHAAVLAGEVNCPVDLEVPLSPVCLLIKAGIQNSQETLSNRQSRRRSDFDKPFSSNNVNLDQIFKLAKENAEVEASSHTNNDQAKEAWIQIHSNIVGAVGQAGMGKTTLAKMLTQNIVNKVVLQDADFIFYIPIRLVDFKKEMSLVQFLLSGTNCYWQSDPTQDMVFLKVLNKSKVVIILDGLDEGPFDKSSNVSAISESSSSTADVFLKNVLAGTILEGAKKVLTSRPGPMFDLVPKLRPHFLVEILGLSVQSQNNLCDQICGKTHSPKVKQQLHEHPELSAYSHMPIYCIMTIACLFQNLVQQAEDQVTCLSDVLFFVFTKYLRTDHHRDNCCKLNKLANLAWSGLSNRQVVFTIEDLEEAGVKESEFQVFLSTCVDEASSLRFRILEGDKRISFSHLIFQEYFAACYLILLMPIDQFKKQLPALKQYNYRVVVKFMFGLSNAQLFAKARSIFCGLKKCVWEEKCSMLIEFLSSYTKELLVSMNQKHILSQICSWVQESKNRVVLSSVVNNIPESIELLGNVKPQEVIAIFYVLQNETKLSLLNVGKMSQSGACVATRFSGNALSRFLDGCNKLVAENKLKIKYICLRQTELLPSDLHEMKQLLHHVTVIALLECNLSLDLIKQLVDVMKSSAVKLDILDLSVNALENEGAAQIAQIVHKIDNLYLRNCDITEPGLQHLARECRLLDKPLKKLDLSFNEVGDEGARYLSECLFKVKCLEMHDCEITKGGVHHLAEGLQSCEKISLTISGNLIGDEGIAAFCDYWHKFDSIGLADCGLSDECVFTIQEKLEEIRSSSSEAAQLPSVRGLHRQPLRGSRRKNQNLPTTQQ